MEGRVAGASASTLEEKVLLLVVDKLIIGAIIAIAFVIYDRMTTADSREYQDRQLQIQLQMERAKLLQDFLPVIQDPALDLVTRGYVLRSAVLTESLDAAAAFELGQHFLRSGLEDNHYERIIGATLPNGIGAFSQRGVQIAIDWYETFGRFPRLDVIFDPLSGAENLPSGSEFVVEGRLLRDILYDNLAKLDHCVCPEISSDEQIPEHLYGLFVLLQTSNLTMADELSRSSSKALQLLGMVIRIWQREGYGDQEALDYLEDELSGAAVSEQRFRRAEVLISIIRWISNKPSGLGSRAFVEILAKIAVGKLPLDTGTVVEDSDLYWLRWSAAEALVLAEDHAEAALPEIVSFLEDFYRDLAVEMDSERIAAVSTDYNSGKIVRLLVDVVANTNAHSAEDVLRDMLSLGNDKLSYFPFLESNVERALASNDP